MGLRSQSDVFLKASFNEHIVFGHLGYAFNNILKFPTIST